MHRNSWLANRYSALSPRRYIMLAMVLLALVSMPALAADSTAKTDQPLISNVFADTFITEALKDVSYQAGVNIIPDNSVQGFVTLELNEVPLDEALRLILYPGGFLYKKLNETTYLVSTLDPNSPLFGEMTVSERIKLNYLKADEAKKLVGDFYTRFARFDPATNTAFITSSAEMVERFKRDLALVDQPPAQFEIQALVTELSEDAHKALGVDLLGETGGASADGEPTLSFAASLGDGTLNLSLRNSADILRAKIVALADEGKVQIHANPRVMVVEGAPAEIFIGKDRYYRINTTTTGTTYTNARLETIGTGVSLKLSARLAQDGYITLQVEPMVSDVSGTVNGEGLPLITRRQATTTIRVKDGETIALGGLIQRTEQTVSKSVPILGDLPILRNLFRSSYVTSEQTEVVIFLTPRVVR